MTMSPGRWAATCSATGRYWKLIRGPVPTVKTRTRLSSSRLRLGSLDQRFPLAFCAIPAQGEHCRPRNQSRTAQCCISGHLAVTAVRPIRGNSDGCVRPRHSRLLQICPLVVSPARRSARLRSASIIRKLRDRNVVTSSFDRTLAVRRPRDIDADCTRAYHSVRGRWWHR